MEKTSMSATIRLRIQIKPYSLKQFVYDLFVAAYATAMVTNALCKRYLHMSLPATARRVTGSVRRVYLKADEIGKNILLVLIVTILGVAGFSWSLFISAVVIADFFGK